MKTIVSVKNYKVSGGLLLSSGGCIPSGCKAW
jgi:hypothetical protein